MHVIEHLERARRPLVSVEIIPPKRGGKIEDFHAALESIAPFDIPFINVTSHAADVEWHEKPDGTFVRKVKRKSPGTFGLCAVIKYKFNSDPVPHLLCAGFTREESEDALIELNYLGIENVLAIRGDGAARHKQRKDRTINEHADELVRQIANMNHGEYQDSLIEAAHTNFCIGVACYPEKHFEAPNASFDLEVLKRKQDAGAHYAITQMVFNNQHYFDFVERARAAGITIPIIPGMKILATKQQLVSLPRAFHVEIPEELTSRVMGAKTRAQVREIGVEWALRQSLELLERGAPSLHFYIMQRTRSFIELMNQLKGTL
ncbi:MAG: methylenetetrahydrofolate reductase [Myxococcales bacterium]|nr:methylenetetrahydrofolate reductase [Myxococcales bacterium]